MKNIHLFRIFLCFLFFASLLGQNLTASANAFDDVLLSDVSITSYINQYQTGENSPLQGTITISHDKRVMIDPLSFRLDNK